MTEGLAAPYVFRGDPHARVVAAAIHAGHDIRPEVADLLVIDEATRLREEDPFTERLTACGDLRVLVNRSRFEVDLNRERREAVYRGVNESWGQRVWEVEPAPDVIERSLELHDQFYAHLGEHLDRIAATGPFVRFDVHSYNHRRDGPDAECAPNDANPDVNVGTGSMSERWRPVADSFVAALSQTKVRGSTLDVRENIRFKGRHFARWIHEHYPTTGCALALEFKKTFMDEWTGVLDEQHLDELTNALGNTIEPVLLALKEAA